MKSVLVSVKDIKVGFCDPISFRDSNAAKFYFVHFVKDMYLHPAEFSVPYRDVQLWKLGEFDLDSGIIEPCMPSLLLSGDSINFEEVSDEE